MKKILTIKPLLQNDYGGALDCSITAITTILKFYFPNLNVQAIYDIVEKNGFRFFYEPDTKGTNPLFIEQIINLSLRDLGKKKASQKRYLKPMIPFSLIKKIINSNNPIVFSILKCNKYSDHTITIVGYDDEKKSIFVYDNWDLVLHEIRYNEIGTICSINWVEINK